MPLRQTDKPAGYLNISNFSTYPLTEKDIKNAFPQTSFPAQFRPPEGYEVVFPAPAPLVDPITQIAREIAPVLTDKGHYEQVWEVVDLDAETVAANQERAAITARESAKASRAKAVAAIKVTTTSGKEFDGDETSQTRMARAIIGMQAANVTTITWTLADNTVVDVTLAELTEALILAGSEQAALWPIN